MADMSVHGQPVYGARECSRHMDSCSPEACSAFTFSRWDFTKTNPHTGILSLSSSQGNRSTIAYMLAFILFAFFIVSWLQPGLHYWHIIAPETKGILGVIALSSFACFALAFE